MDTRTYTVIETQVSDLSHIQFEWYGGRTVNVVNNFDHIIVDTFTFKNTPTLEQVIKACEEY